MSKKPAKRNTSESTPNKKIDTGFNVKYIGAKGFPHICPLCKSSRGKGIVREYKNILYCGVGCVLKYQRFTENQSV